MSLSCQSLYTNASFHNLVAQEELKDALASTYTEFRKHRDEARALGQRCADMEAAHKAESAQAARESRGKAEALQGQYRARMLEINELEASHLHFQGVLS